jgi:hypothetical protein
MLLLTSSISPERLEPVAGRHAKVLQPHSGVKIRYSGFRRATRSKRLNLKAVLVPEQRFGIEIDRMTHLAFRQAEYQAALLPGRCFPP